MPLCDAHCHLQDERLSPGLEDALRRARSANVEAFICCGSEESDWHAVETLASASPDIIPQFGLHPWYIAKRSPDWITTLQSLLDSHPKAGLGEAGLDHAIKERADEDQLSVFKTQLELAREMKRPVSIHCRRAWGAMLDTLKSFGFFKSGLLFHSFSGSADLIPDLTTLGGFFSFSGAITFSGNKRGRKALASAPLDRILIETDSPDLHPNTAPLLTDSGGKPVNEPANLISVLNTASTITNIPPEQLKSVLWKNSAGLFQL